MKNPQKEYNTAIYRAREQGGFSLVEVLVVIAIISVLMTAGAIGLGNLTAGKGTTSAIAACESLFEEARTTAISKRAKTRIMVDVQNINSDSYLRRVVIAHEKVNADGTVQAGQWVLANRGYTMPPGTFFSRVFSVKEAGGAMDQASITLKSEAGANMSDYSGRYVYYEFNGEGIFQQPGASFIIASGARPKGREPLITASAKRDFAGFVIWRNGRTSSYRSPDQMNIPQTTKNF
ncbi:Tfp pilus assembly protein FimT/FimU [Luteolibacter algae]|uniref:Tfp pilus assembly protein FimT/FimU n=1 Tax=Luteolibacter algae TaxID=454151 RepID=A0ABW5D807_9BACT